MAQGESPMIGLATGLEFDQELSLQMGYGRVDEGCAVRKDFSCLRMGSRGREKLKKGIGHASKQSL